MKSTLILFAFVFAFNACSQKNTAPASESSDVVVEETKPEQKTDKKPEVDLQKKELEGAQIRQSVKSNIDVSKFNQLKKVDTTQQTPEPKKP